LAAWLLEEAGGVPDFRVTINRALARLRHDGLIAVGLRQVDILAPELLNLRASG